MEKNSTQNVLILFTARLTEKNKHELSMKNYGEKIAGGKFSEQILGKMLFNYFEVQNDE